METTKSRTAMLSKVLRIVYVGVLLAHLLMWALDVKGQGLTPIAVQPKYPLVESQRARVKQIYTSQLGVREKQPNSGVEVEKYLRYVGLQKGNPWCAAFVCWTLGEAGVENPGSGWSPDLFTSSKVIWRSAASPVSGIKYQVARSGSGRLDSFSQSPVDGNIPASRSTSPPRPITDYRLLITGSSPIKTPLPNPPTPTTGDVFGLYFPEKGRIAHVGFVDEWKDGWVMTVEGNTNVVGSREGDGVYRKRRLVRSIYKVARYVE